MCETYLQYTSFKVAFCENSTKLEQISFDDSINTFI
jgi:hypothetical protein